MYEAVDIHTQQVYRFRSLMALVLRLGGDGWAPEHDSAFDPPGYRVQITKWRPKQNGHEVLAVVYVPAEALRDPIDLQVDEQLAPR